MELAEPSGTNSYNARDDSPSGEPSVSSSLEHLMAGSQGVITKRIDLALLEGQELLSRTLQRAALVAFAMVLAAGAWFAVAACLVLLVTPNASPVIRLAAFGVLNAGGALGLVALAMRGRPQTPAGANSNVSSTTEEP
ncbi:MAG: phage holin family protein [Candidatus Binatia bacterium]